MRAKCSMTGERLQAVAGYMSAGNKHLLQTETIFGEWNKAHVSNLRSAPPAADLWLVYQAQSLTGRTVTIPEAKELFKFVDVVTRKVKEPEPDGTGVWQAIQLFIRTQLNQLKTRMHHATQSS